MLNQSGERFVPRRLLLCLVPRRRRHQFPGAIFHVINRGNYRRDIFEDGGAKARFEKSIFETAERMDWWIYAYVVMRNHFHIVLRISSPNLSTGMHWLQGSFANRFNRFRCEHGYLFQNRFKANLVQPDRHLAFVVNYVHLNPVQARIVPFSRLAEYRASSFARFSRGIRPPRLICADWLQLIGCPDARSGWEEYVSQLGRLASCPAEQAEQGFHEMGSAWAHGTEAWRQDLAKHAVREGAAVPREQLWELKLAEELAAQGKSSADVRADPKGAKWKVAIALRLRRCSNVSIRWLAQRLNMGAEASVRVYLSQGVINT